jgi:hypothetical protein
LNAFDAQARLKCRRRLAQSRNEGREHHQEGQSCLVPGYLRIY